MSWKSYKQSTVIDSKTEGEYMATTYDEAKEDVWIKIFISELGLVPIFENGIELYCDNNGAIAQSKEPSSHHLNMCSGNFIELERSLEERM